ncbi:MULTISPECIES: SWIM zinc finger family protein [Streptomyces]
MNPQGERRTAEQVLALAPDAASRAAGDRLGRPGPWSGTGRRTSAVWGWCEGSGSTPYRTVVDLGGTNFQCSCPSRKTPCKHALGLLLLWSRQPAEVPEAEAAAVPDWVGQWLARRRRAERRTQRIAAGAVELEQRLTDLLQGGLAAAEGAGYGQWDETAARMVDAQAPGLAARVRDLAGIGAARASHMLEECALLHTLNQGFLRVDELPPALAATVRSRVGLPANTTGPPVRDHWLVLAQRDSDDGRLTTRRIWLRGRKTGRMALLLAYGGGGRPVELTLPVGLEIDAELAFYAGARPLRAALGPSYDAPAPAAAPPPGSGIADALRVYGEVLADDPWVEGWPVVLEGVVPVPPGGAEEGWQLADPAAGEAVPVPGDDGGLWHLAAVSGGRPVRVFGECGHRGFAPLGVWAAEELLPL